MPIDLYDANNIMYRSGIAGFAPRLSLRQRYEEQMAKPAGSQFWVWDGYGHNARRQEIYPPYKTNRTPTPEDISSQAKLWRELLRHTPGTQIEVNGWEADDVIGTLARRFSRRGVPVRIHTNDMDYGQLEHLDGVTLVGVNTKGVPGEWVALYKAMQGDKSDNISGVPGFGPERWKALEDYWPKIRHGIAMGDHDILSHIPFTKSVATWLKSKENLELLQAMLTVTHFENVPDDEIEGGIIEGKPNRRAAIEILDRYFL